MKTPFLLLLLFPALWLSQAIDWDDVSTTEHGVESSATEAQQDSSSTDDVDVGLVSDWDALEARIRKYLVDAGLDTPEYRFFYELVLDLFRPRPYTDGNLFLLSSLDFGDTRTIFAVA
jgi:hypothetical protein